MADARVASYGLMRTAVFILMFALGAAATMSAHVTVWLVQSKAGAHERYTG